ncbi:MAG TPA: hypothetical protein PLP39_05625 [Flavobacterium lutivivi]|nr:hypothetical protein [Flavobacterium lutivivi]
MTRLNYLYFLLIPIVFFGQNKPIKINLLSVTSTDSIPDERKFVVNYSIENTTDKEICFFLNPDVFSPAHQNSLQPYIFYKLFQNNTELAIDGVFEEKIFQFPKFPDLRNITDETIKQQLVQEYLKKRRELTGETSQVSMEEMNKSRSQRLMSSIIILKPFQKKNFSKTLFWNKERYYVFNNTENYLDEKANYEIQILLIVLRDELMKDLTNDDKKSIKTFPDFIEGVFASDKIKINLAE